MSYEYLGRLVWNFLLGIVSVIGAWCILTYIFNYEISMNDELWVLQGLMIGTIISTERKK